MCTLVIPSDTIYWVNSRISNRIKFNAVLNDESYEIWHQRMGHISCQAISHLRKQVKNGPKMEHLKPSNIRPCKGCAKGKMTRNPFPESQSRAMEVLRLWHSDLKE